MKNIVFVMMTLLSQSAFAGGLMIKQQTSGLVGPNDRFSVKCEIAHNFTIEEKLSGSNWKREVDVRRTIYTKGAKDGATVSSLVKQAAAGKMIITEGRRFDVGPQYRGVIPGDVVDQYVKIFLDYGAEIQTNSETEAVKALVEFADVNCPIKE